MSTLPLPAVPMGNRKHLRIKNVLPIRVWGMDSTGNPFVELAHTMDISHTGVRIGGASAVLSPGDVVHIQYHHRKAKFEVAWAGKPGTARAKQIGVRSLEAGKDIWSLELPPDEVEDRYEPPQSNKKFVNTRAHPRLTATAGVDYIIVGTPEGAWAELKDISAGGCYLSTQVPAYSGSELEMLIQLGPTRINVFGLVRTCHPRTGMGIEFTRFRSQDDKRSLEMTLGEIEAAPLKTATDDSGKPDALTVATRLQAITHELYDVEQLIISSMVDPEILYEFREAVGRVRSTSWALQRWMELQKNNENPFPVVTFLNSERIRLATRLCNSLLEDLRQHEIRAQKKHLDELLRSVEDLFTHLAGIDFCVLHPLSDQEMTPELQELLKQKAAGQSS